MAGQRFNSGRVADWGATSLPIPYLTSASNAGLPNSSFIAQGTQQIYSDRICYGIFYVEDVVTVRALTLEITTASAALSTARMGICSWSWQTDANTPGGVPNEVIVDAGTVSASSLGLKEISGLSIVLQAGFYATMVIGSAAPTLRGMRYGHMPGGFPVSAGDGRFGNFVSLVDAAQSSGFIAPLPLHMNGTATVPPFVTCLVRWTGS